MAEEGAAANRLPLSARQQAILDVLNESGARATFAKRAVSMRDLRNLTAHTGDEFAMFTRGSQRLIIRGAETMVPVTPEMGAELASQGFRWSGHTHPAGWSQLPSQGDIAVLNGFGQNRSAIWNLTQPPQVFYANPFAEIASRQADSARFAAMMQRRYGQ